MLAQPTAYYSAHVIFTLVLGEHEFLWRVGHVYSIRHSVQATSCLLPRLTLTLDWERLASTWLSKKQQQHVINLTTIKTETKMLQLRLMRFMTHLLRNQTLTVPLVITKWQKQLSYIPTTTEKLTVSYNTSCETFGNFLILRWKNKPKNYPTNNSKIHWALATWLSMTMTCTLTPSNWPDLQSLDNNIYKWGINCTVAKVHTSRMCFTP